MAIPNFYKKELLDPLVSETLKVMLLTDSHTINIDTQEFIDDVSGNEIAGTGYTAGGKALAGKSVTQDDTNDLAKFDATDTEWPTSSFTARYAVIYKDTGTPGTSPIRAQIDFGSNKQIISGTFKIQWNANGVIRILDS